jgi:hypothetical protein
VSWVFCVNSGWKCKPDKEIVVEKYVTGLLLLYTSQNLLGTIFRVTFTVFYRRIWNIVGKYSTLYCDNCLASRTLSGYVVVFILFCDKVEGCIGVYTDWHESKTEIFHQVQYGELAMFRELAEWVTRFAEDGVNWSNTLPEVARTLTTRLCRSSTKASF